MNKEKTMKLLIVEGNVLVQAALKEMLKQFQDCSSDFAEDGKTALALYNDQYDLVLMDIDLPDINGIVVTQTIRKIEKNRHVPIVAMTSHFGEKEYQKRFKLAGMNGFSSKPDMSQLQALIRTYTPTVCSA